MTRIFKIPVTFGFHYLTAYNRKMYDRDLRWLRDDGYITVEEYRKWFKSYSMKVGLPRLL